MKTKIIVSIGIFLMGILLLSPFPAHAAQNLQDALGNLQGTGQIAYGEQPEGDLGTIVGRIINVALSLVGVIFLVLMVYAGFLWMTARGEEGQIDKAKKIIVSSIIGLVVVASAYAITALVTGTFQ